MSTADSNHDQLASKPRGLKNSLQLGLSAALLAAVISFFLPNYYRSEAKILPADAKNSGSLGQLAATAASFGMAIPSMDSADANYVDILKSRAINDELLNTEFQFHERSWHFGKNELHRQTLYAYIQEKNMDRAVIKMGKVVTVSKDVKSKIISVDAETKSPELSQQIVEKLRERLENFVQVKNRTKGGEKARFAEARLAESRREMAMAEERFRQFLEGNRNFQTSPDPTIRLIGLRLEAELKLREQLVLTLSMNLEQSLLEEKNDIPIVNVLDSANLPIDEDSPKRIAIVLLSFLTVSIGAWMRLNYQWLRGRLLDLDGENGVPDAQNREKA
jgi:LPS O-antigen subunit length determinant protein (WzzB/FepE family)